MPSGLLLKSLLGKTCCSLPSHSLIPEIKLRNAIIAEVDQVGAAMFCSVNLLNSARRLSALIVANIEILQ